MLLLVRMRPRPRSRVDPSILGRGINDDVFEQTTFHGSLNVGCTHVSPVVGVEKRLAGLVFLIEEAVTSLLKTVFKSLQRRVFASHGMNFHHDLRRFGITKILK